MTLEFEAQMEADPQQLPLVVISGPTAAGKTELAVALGACFDAEAVSVDSRQFYRRMDIGTAKPTVAERAALPHHLIDIADPDATVGLAQFLRLAQLAIADIHARGKLPLLVGGTGQYVRALLQGWQMPEVLPDLELRATLEQRARRDPEGLWRELLARDPGAADFIDPRNVRRVVRALEVCLKTGAPFSTQRRRVAPAYRVLQLGLTLEREALYARADARVELMMTAGLPAEVERLLAAGYGWELPAMSGVGYRQFKPYFAGQATLAEVTTRIQLDTHDFIRRQYAWFSLKDPAIVWLAPGEVAAARARIAAWL